MPTKVWITEEYGYREWLWTHPGDADDVVAAWKRGDVPVNFWGLREGQAWAGTCEQFYPADEMHEKAAAAIEALNLDPTDENHPFVKEALAMLEVAARPDAIMRQYGCVAHAHVHEHADTCLTAFGVTYGPWREASDES